MKKIYFTLMAIAAVSFVACNSGSGEAGNADSIAKAKADSTEAARKADSIAKATPVVDTTKGADTTKPAATPATK